MADKGYNYKDKGSVKLSDEFRQKFIVNIKGKEAVKLEGLTVLAHEKGLWKLETEIIQFPSDANQWTAICRTTVGGYDYDPVTDKIREVIYSDIGDANPSNCTKLVAASYIRMASTRSQGRALRKYTDIDMVCSSELDNATEEPPESIITIEQLTEVKKMLKEKGFNQEKFGALLFNLFKHQNFAQLTMSQGDILINTLHSYPDIQKQNENVNDAS